MVLVDASAPYQFERMNPVIARANEQFLHKQGLLRGYDAIRLASPQRLVRPLARCRTGFAAHDRMPPVAMDHALCL
jgi:hypothetical protein